jgi:aspartyl aminopeptidase
MRVKELLFKTKNGWLVKSRNDVEKFSRGYIEFIGKCKTERKVVEFSEDILRRNGFVSVDEYSGETPSKVYMSFKKKALIAMKVSKKLTEGMNLVVAHIDSPRIDLKPHPIIEDEGIALAKTHYYGGVKKYQWFNIPLSIVGVVVKEDGTVIDVNIGENEDDPVFVISDLLPHLDRKDEKVSEKFQAEKMNLILGSIPIDDKEKESVKLNILKILNEKYGIKEEDLISADLELVPAFSPREVGLDRSFIAAYGHDDRICAYTALMALLDTKEEKNMGVILFDREEIGSDGNTGAKSRFYMNFFRKVLKKQGFDDVEYFLDEALENTYVISADVNAAVNPSYKDVHDLSNAAKAGHGVVLTKYTGARGKVGASEASAELVAKVRAVLNKRNVLWQVGTLGKVDVGGGGTVAKFLAEKGADVIDMGPGLIGMHSPYELVSKIDLYESYEAYKVLMEEL